MFKRESKKGTGALTMTLVLIGVFAATSAGASVLEPEKPSSAANVKQVASLSPGEFVFWEEPLIKGHRGVNARPVADPVLCGKAATVYGCMQLQLSSPTVYVYFTGGLFTAGEVACKAKPEVCFDYLIEVKADEATGKGGSELAVSLDHPSAYNMIEVVLISPKGEVVEYSGCSHVCNTFEMNALNPAPGRWTFRVFLHNVENTGFRMRAIVHPQNTEDEKKPSRPFFPNLQMIAPFEMVIADCQFVEELNVKELSYEARQCLRFSTGPTNVGSGPLDMRPAPHLDDLDVNDPTKVLTEGDNVQRIHNSNGGYTELPAGRYEWHREHGHYHHTGMGDFELYRVKNRHSGKLEPVGGRHKQGFCIGDVTINNWRSFDNARQTPALEVGRCTAMVDPPIGALDPRREQQPMFYMGNGWGDPYPWWVEGNFIERKGLEDGLYVLRASTDPDDVIIESDDGDNTSYSYFRLEGNKIEVLERGRGLSPWDKNKEVANDTRWPTLRPHG